MKIKIFCRNKDYLPFYATDGSAGMDLYADITEPVVLSGFQVKAIPTGVFLELPDGVEAQIRPRSSMGKSGIIIPNAPGTIDSDYRGEISVLLLALSNNVMIMPGQKIAQIVFSNYLKAKLKQVESSDKLSITERGDGGFGSTGI